VSAMEVQQKIVEKPLTQQELEGWLWKVADILRGAVKPEKYGTFVLPLLFFKRLSDVYKIEYEKARLKYKSANAARQKFVHKFADIPKGCMWEDLRKESKNVGGKLNKMLGKIAKANPELDGVINRTDFNRPDELPPQKLIKLIEHFSGRTLANGNIQPDMLGNVYEYLLKKFNEVAPARAGEFYTPREIIKIMIEILDPDEGAEIYDPCAGSGGMLIFSHLHLLEKKRDPKNVFLYGQEFNAETCAMARMNVMLHGLEAKVSAGDTLADPKFLDGNGLKKFDIVIANPMWNQDGYKEVIEKDKFGRFTYGTPSNSSADWGWIQHMLASLKPDGRMGVVLDQGALFRGGAEGKIRGKIIEADLVECVVSLPEKLFYNTGSPGCLIFLNKDKPRQRQGKILFVYATKDFEKLKNMNHLRDQDIDTTVQAFRNYKDMPKRVAVVPLEQVRKNKYNLSVTRYMDVFEPESIIDIEQTWREITNLNVQWKTVNEQLQASLRELGYE